MSLNNFLLANGGKAETVASAGFSRQKRSFSVEQEIYTASDVDAFS